MLSRMITGTTEKHGKALKKIIVPCVSVLFCCFRDSFSMRLGLGGVQAKHLHYKKPTAGYS